MTGKSTFDSEGEFEEEESGFEGYEPKYHPEAGDRGTFWCPKCGEEMYGDATLCRKCGDFVTPGLRPRSVMSLWLWVGLILVGLILLGGFIAGVLAK